MQLIYLEPYNFYCQCGCHTLPKESIMLLTDKIRQLFGSPLVVTSGARCQKHQDELIAQGLSKAKHSRHITGDAVDLAPTKRPVALFHTFLKDNAEALNIWIEAPSHTPLWGHVQGIPYPNWAQGKSRVFVP